MEKTLFNLKPSKFKIMETNGEMIIKGNVWNDQMHDEKIIYLG